MSTELTRDLHHRLNPEIKMWLEEQFGELQIVVEGDGHSFVFRLARDDAQVLSEVMLNWIEATERV